MAVSSAPINSTNIWIGITEDSGTTYDTVAFCTSATFSLNMDPRDITTKDDAGWAKNAEGKLSWTTDFDGLVTGAVVSDKDTPADIFTLATNRTEVGVRYGYLNSGDFVYTGNGYFTSLSQDAGVEDNNTFSVSFIGSGALTQAAFSG